eukprot:6732624-Pyramimonas_sp.AAC.1
MAAFQRLRRDPAIQAMAVHVPEIAWVLDKWYSGPTKHVWRGAAGHFEEVESTLGFDQGTLWRQPPSRSARGRRSAS